MQKIGRRRFIGNMIATSAALVAARSVKAADARIEILMNEPIGTISPDIYSHFIEHLGGVIYDGVWVGEQSKIPNMGGIRSAFVEHMRKIKPAVVRWPGGCFADSYNWRDGVGPRKDRPQRTDFWANDIATEATGPQVYEPNHFGTNEFVRLCKLTGSQTYLAANVRSLTAKDFYEWVEYCNAPANATTLARMRAAAGEGDPFGVRYWGVGNESWGCGGNMTAEEYAVEFRKFIAWVPRYGVKLLRDQTVAIGAGHADYLRSSLRKAIAFSIASTVWRCTITLAAPENETRAIFRKLSGTNSWARPTAWSRSSMIIGRSWARSTLVAASSSSLTSGARGTRAIKTCPKIICGPMPDRCVTR
jgi:hypothetical protein